MAYRSDVPYNDAILTLTEFQQFDHGGEATMWVKAKWKVQVGDILDYEAGNNISGKAQVTKVEPDKRPSMDQCTVVKMS